MDAGFSGFDSGPNHVDPDRVFALVASRRPGDLAGYLASIPGAPEDAHCRLANSAGLALLDPTLRSSWPPQPDEDSWIQYLAQYARTQALMSRFVYVGPEKNVYYAIETTLWSIEWGIAELVNHPEIQQKLRDEMDAVLGAGHQITEPDTHKLPYLQAVIKETLRLRMAIPLLLPHMNLHDAKLAGYNIPAESKILVNAWFLANNPEQWRRPDEFRPERFLEEERHVEASGNDFRFLPFGVGRRSCPGIILALPIIGITIGRLVQNFELTTPPGVDMLDTSEKGGQFSLQILNHSTIVAKPRVF